MLFVLPRQRTICYGVNVIYESFLFYKLRMSNLWDLRGI